MKDCTAVNVLYAFTAFSTQPYVIMLQKLYSSQVSHINGALLAQLYAKIPKIQYSGPYFSIKCGISSAAVHPKARYAAQLYERYERKTYRTA